MISSQKKPGQFMASEILEAPEVFSCNAIADHSLAVSSIDLSKTQAFYTIARGSSDAVATILSYLFMSRLCKPATSLPPSIFSIYKDIHIGNAVGLVISQSGTSDDLVSCAKGIRKASGKVIALTNRPGSPVEDAANLTIPVSAGVERAIPATKSVIGSIAAGMSLLTALDPTYRKIAENASFAMRQLAHTDFIEHEELRSALQRANHVYVLGRGAGFGAAQEVALKLKETIALHAEAYSAAEALHGPLQLATNELFVLILDTGELESQASLDKAELMFRSAGADVLRLAPQNKATSCSAAAAAMLILMLYPILLSIALDLGLDPDRPSTLSKVTRTS